MDGDWMREEGDGDDNKGRNNVSEYSEATINLSLSPHQRTASHPETGDDNPASSDRARTHELDPCHPNSPSSEQRDEDGAFFRASGRTSLYSAKALAEHRPLASYRHSPYPNLSSSMTASSPFLTPSPFVKPDLQASSSGLPIISTASITNSMNPSLLALPTGSMSTSKRRTPPSFPRDRRERHHQSLSTPSALRIPPTPQYSPGSHRSALLRHHISPTGPLTAPYTPHRPYPSSAPPISAARLPNQSVSPSSPNRPTYRLVGAPQEWVVKGLNRNAGAVWNDPESADCHVFIPIASRLTSPIGGTQPTSATTPNFARSVHSGLPPHPNWPPSPARPVDGELTGDEGKFSQQLFKGRRASVPEAGNVPVLVFPLHRDYLITQSKLFRALLSRLPTPSTPLLPPQSPTSPLPSPTAKGMKVLPTKPGNPNAVFCPLPDPSSFGVLVHWLYWGNTEALEYALSRGLVTWQGLVRNIDYLDMDDSVKRAVGKWWRRWVRPATGRSPEHDGLTSGNGIGKGKGKGKGKGRGAWCQGSVESDAGTAMEESSGDEADEEGEMEVERLNGDGVADGDEEGERVERMMRGL